MSKKIRSTQHTSRQHRRQDRRAEANYRHSERQAPTKSPAFEDQADIDLIKPRSEPIYPLTEGQADYDEAIRTNKIIYGIGPAGTGKTWFAAMRAAEALKRGDIERIFVTRPVIEAEESLGFLPGELEEKYEPYLRPVKDALEEYFGTGHLGYLLRKKIIEPRPLAFLRGSTLKNCWVLADEMQNATLKQHKLLLTRFGEGAKFIVNGDATQMDIPAEKSGLLEAARRLKRIEKTEVVTFKREEIVREGIVQEIVEAFED